MSDLWMRNGKLIIDDADALVLCDTCPCNWQYDKVALNITPQTYQYDNVPSFALTPQTYQYDKAEINL